MRAMAKAERKGAVHGTIRPMWVAPIAALLTLVSLAGLFAGYEEFSNTTPNPTLGWAGIGAALAAAAIALLLAAVTRRELRVDSKSLSLRKGFGKPVVIEWSEPHDYYYRSVSGQSTPTVEKASVRTPDGRRIDVDETKLRDFPNANVPGLVERYSAAANLPKIKARLEEGDDVEFGPVSMSGGQMTIEDSSHSVEGGFVVHIKNGRLQVGVDGEWISTGVSVHDVPNFPCLLRLIGQITHARPPG